MPVYYFYVLFLFVCSIKCTTARRQHSAGSVFYIPKLNFPHDFLETVKQFGYNGATIDGQEAPVNPISPANDAERY